MGKYHSQGHYRSSEVQINNTQDLGNCGQERYERNVIPMDQNGETFITT